jgi:hypothetical protein
VQLLENLEPANIGLGSFFRSAIFILGAWPATFIARPALTLTATGPDQSCWQHVWGSQGKRHSAIMAGEAVLLRATATELDFLSLDVMAIGRWY